MLAAKISCSLKMSARSLFITIELFLFVCVFFSVCTFLETINNTFAPLSSAWNQLNAILQLGVSLLFFRGLVMISFLYFSIDQKRLSSSTFFSSCVCGFRGLCYWFKLLQFDSSFGYFFSMWLWMCLPVFFCLIRSSHLALISDNDGFLFFRMIIATRGCLLRR